MARLLTDRQTEVMELLCAGTPEDETARLLGITEKAVRSHLHLIRGRLRATGLTELCARASGDLAAAARERRRAEKPQDENNRTK